MFLNIIIFVNDSKIKGINIEKNNGNLSVLPSMKKKLLI